MIRCTPADEDQNTCGMFSIVIANLFFYVKMYLLFSRPIADGQTGQSYELKPLPWSLSIAAGIFMPYTSTLSRYP